MTFNEIVLLIQDRDASWGCWLTLEQAKERAVYEILEGFRNLDDARDGLEISQDTGNLFFTLYGYEIDTGALEAAIKCQEALEAE